MTMDRIEVITSVERRRRWSAAEKARLVAAMNEPDAVVSGADQRHAGQGVCRRNHQSRLGAPALCLQSRAKVERAGRKHEL